MNMAEFIGISIYFVGAFILALGLIFALGFALEAESRLGKFLLPSILAVIALGMAISTILVGRGLVFVDLNSASAATLSAIANSNPMRATWPLRFATLYILAAALALIFSYYFRRQNQLDAAKPLMLAFFAFFLGNNVIDAIFGTVPTFVPNHFYAIFVFLAAYVTRKQDTAILLRYTKIILFAFLAGSILLVVLKPNIALQKHYLDGIIPHLHVRLWGLAPHANDLAPLGLLYLLLEIYEPGQHRLLRWSGYGIGLIVVILAQSKTTWAAGALAMSIVVFYRYAPQLKNAWETGRVPYQMMMLAILVFSGAFLLLFLLLSGSLDHLTDKFFQSTAGQQLFTLSGRNQIWDVAIKVWEQNPLFGYGPQLWDPKFRYFIGMNFAYSAHNQFLQSLSEAGLVGILAMVSYIVAMLAYSYKLARPSRGLSLALGVFIFLRCLTETPLSTNTLFNGDFFIHLFAFSYLVRCAAASPDWKPTFAAAEDRPKQVKANLAA